MDRRLLLQDELEQILGSQEVNFQPPESIKLQYPCINYSLTSGDTLHADDKNYKHVRGYTLLAISRDPDNDMAKNIMDHFPMCRFVRRYIYDNLYHDVLELYY